MPDLATFQHDFARALMADGPIGAVSQRTGFAVYRNTTARGIVEALRAAFPTVDMLVGEDMFTQVALDFRLARPPEGPVLSEYGGDFPDYLARQPWTCELPYLADVARLDRLWLDSFLAADELTLLSTTPGAPRIFLHPAARFTWLATPAMTIWLAHRDPWSLDALEPDWREEGALFTRPGNAVRAETIEPACHRLLLACASAMPLADCVASVGAAFPETDVAALLDRCLAAGALIIR